MPTIIFKTELAEPQTVDADVDYTVMEAAYNNEVPGIIAECGGGAACGTCHVYVDKEFLHLLEPVMDVEDAMLYMVSDRRSNSRLSCQLRVTEELDGLVVEVADNEF